MENPFLQECLHSWQTRRSSQVSCDGGLSRPPHPSNFILCGAGPAGQLHDTPSSSWPWSSSSRIPRCQGVSLKAKFRIPNGLGFLMSGCCLPSPSDWHFVCVTKLITGHFLLSVGPNPVKTPLKEEDRNVSLWSTSNLSVGNRLCYSRHLTATFVV